MITVAIHSPNNPDILIAMHDALEFCGIQSKREWNILHNPNRLNEFAKYSDMTVFYYTLMVEGVMGYYNHDCSPEVNEHIDLTRENFGDVLNFVLLAQYWEL